MSSQCTLPTELICNILYYVNPRDIIRWRTVSKWFRAITYDSAIWKVIYENTPFIHVNLPFPSSRSTSTVSLERAVVRSTRLAQTWITSSLRVVSHVEIPFIGKPSKYFTNDGLIGGRWLLVCQSNQRLVLYDTDANAETRVPQILWEQEEPISDWNRCPWWIPQEGQWSVYVLLSEKYSRRWRLIHFLLDVESGAPRDAVALDVPNTANFSLPRLRRDLSPFLFIPNVELIFVTGTCLFYKFPQFRIALDETRSMIDEWEELHTPMHVLLTNTHIFSFFRIRDMKYLIQAFTVPDDQPSTQDRTSFLQLSHEGIMSEGAFCAVIRNSVVDPITGSISVRFLDFWFGYRQPRCIDVTLHKPSPVDVSSMTIRSHAVFANKRLPTSTELHFCNVDDGYARGLYTERGYYGTDVCFLNRSAIMRYTIDAAQDYCLFTLGQRVPLPEEWKHINDMHPTELGSEFVICDCIPGRSYYIRYEGKQPERKQFLVVMDFE